jgi:hypothetical protein
MPSARAVRFMRPAKAETLPPTFSATTTATSLADLVVSARMASSTLMVEPAFTPTLDGAWRAAFADTLSLLPSESRPASSSSKST